MTTTTARLMRSCWVGERSVARISAAIRNFKPEHDLVGKIPADLVAGMSSL
jgi:hypothetical protein